MAPESRYIMDYEIVILQEKTIVGVTAVTSNEDSNAINIIGSLWRKLYQEDRVAKIKNRLNEYSIGLYSDYNNAGYTVTVGCEVLKMSEQEVDALDGELSVKYIPSGKYAKFEVHGDVQEAVRTAWEAICKMELDRTFTGDFEEYVDNNMNDATIYIYVAIK